MTDCTSINYCSVQQVHTSCALFFSDVLEIELQHTSHLTSVFHHMSAWLVDHDIRTGSKFEGTWDNDRINGEGISYYPNGNRYEGEWQNGRINGRGA